MHIFAYSLDGDPDPAIIFGDFNFRLDQYKFLKVRLCHYKKSLLEVIKRS